MKIDGHTYWDYKSDKVALAQDWEKPIPSDARFRKDLIALSYGDESLS